MKVGISTASLFGRYYTEDALEKLNELGVDVAEVFLESYSEYTKKFGKILKKKKGNVDIHSIHTLTTQFEPQLYSLNDRAREESFKLLDGTLQAGQTIGAKYYTFHGVARIKRVPIHINFERVGELTNKIIDACKKHDMLLSYENVHWAYYNYIGFFSTLKKYCPDLKGTFDVKQARQSGVDYREFINEMGSDIVTAHLSDINSDGKMCLPGRGETDFDEMFSRLRDVQFDGSLILEVYKTDFESMDELLESYEFVKDKAKRIFAY